MARLHAGRPAGCQNHGGDAIYAVSGAGHNASMPGLRPVQRLRLNLQPPDQCTGGGEYGIAINPGSAGVDRPAVDYQIEHYRICLIFIA